MVIFVLLCSAIAYLVTFVLLQTLSRYREYAADRGAAIITGRPSALSSALLKVSSTMSQIPSRDLRAAAHMNAFFILPASRNSAGTGLFASHPPVEKRIAALSRLEAQLQQAA
jgi:heat shock protein HtpX